MSENKPDLMAELAEVAGKIEAFRDLPFNAERRKLYTDAASAAVELIRTHHAELEAVARDAAIGRAYLRWYAAAEGYRNVIADAAHEAIMAEAMHNSAREG